MNNHRGYCFSSSSDRRAEVAKIENVEARYFKKFRICLPRQFLLSAYQFCDYDCLWDISSIQVNIMEVQMRNSTSAEEVAKFQ